MNFNFTAVPYQSTNSFSRIITDYLGGSPNLKPLFTHSVSLEGLQNSLEARKEFKVDRELLYQHLNHQYKILETSEKVNGNILKLKEENTFTVCTAHQPTLFTGTLYFIYKILHTIRLASFLEKEHPGTNFVPVFYMGSEDADLEELSKIYLHGEKITWPTTQTGAVGRMNNKGLDAIIERIEGELGILPHGAELVRLLRDSFLKDENIQTGIFRLINALFSKYGLIVLIPDDARLKTIMRSIFEDDLFNHKPSEIVNNTIEKLAEHYKVQANPRAINLFYLKDDLRERIEKDGDEWKVVGTDIRFNKSSLLNELNEYPERFSPNVILRGLFQEMLLPNIAFIGGGGELAYWLELKALFEHYGVPYPVLVLRNSFLIIEKKWKELMDKLELNAERLFHSADELEKSFIIKRSGNKLTLEKELEQINDLYHNISRSSGEIDPTLKNHVAALQNRVVEKLQGLEKKLLRAEKKKFDATGRQIKKLKENLFPRNGLQERVENFMPFYALWGKEFIDQLYQYSFTIEQEFGVLVEYEIKN